MSRAEIKLILFPLLGLPTRREYETACGHDPAKIQKVATLAWRMFRAVAVGCVTGWLVIVGTLAGLIWSGMLAAEDVAFVRRLGVVATALLGTAVFIHYPWPFRDSGSRWVRWAVLAVGVPSAAAFVAVFVGAV